MLHGPSLAPCCARRKHTRAQRQHRNSKTGDCDSRQRTTGAACRTPLNRTRGQEPILVLNAPLAARGHPGQRSSAAPSKPQPQSPSTRFCSSASGRFHNVPTSSAARPFRTERCCGASGGAVAALPAAPRAVRNSRQHPWLLPIPNGMQKVPVIRPRAAVLQQQLPPL